MIPKKIFQTFETKDVPFGMSKALISWQEKNPTWEYKFFDKQDRVDFITKNFDKDVLLAYKTLLPGAFKADLWRYCVLYIEGGVYVDADTICELPLDNWLDTELSLVVTRDDPMANKWLGNAFIASKPRHKALVDCIRRIVKHTQEKKERFYLDYTGPALWGKCVNKSLIRHEETDYELGLYKDINVLKHDWGRTKYVDVNNTDILHVEYPGKVQEMDNIGNKKFYDYVQAKTIFREIPYTILYTSYDLFDVNNYMVDSFTEKNQDYEMLYYDQNGVEKWFNNSIYKEAYSKLTERGEKTDFFRYCYLYENGGVYTDTDTFCNVPLDNFIEHQHLVVGLEANTDLDIFEGIVDKVNGKYVSVCNWFIAVKPKHPVLSKVINDIIDNPKEGVLQNTGPGRFTKHILDYFGRDNDFNVDIVKDKSELLSINRLGSNQSHSNSKKFKNPFLNNDKDIYITHMFDGTWRTNTSRQLKTINTEYCSHNLSLIEKDNGYLGVARLDKDTSRTWFMKKIGECMSCYQFTFDKELNLLNTQEKVINYKDKVKFEDFRSFNYKGKIYHSVSYIKEDWSTTIGILDDNYNFIKDVEVEQPNKMSFGVGQEVIWEKNWLFFTHNNELHFIYNTSPNYVVYKNTRDFVFQKIIDTDNVLKDKFPEKELYFSSRVKVGGSTQPVWLEEQSCYVYLVHTKLYQDRAYNHYAVKLDKDLNLIDISYKPVITSKIPYGLFFISTWIRKGDHLIISGGLEDNKNWIWQIPIKKVLSSFNI